MKNKRSMLSDKRGADASTGWGLIDKLIFALVIIILLVFIYFLVEFLISICNSLVHSTIQEDLAKPGFRGWFYKYGYQALDWLGFNTGAEDIAKYGSCGGWLWNKIKTTGGFLWHIFVGLLAGVWVFVFSQIGNALVAGAAHVRVLSGNTKKITQRNRWLKFIGDQVWKIPAIAIGYAIFMEVPIVNTIIKIITLEIIGVNSFLVSFIIAFWVGLAPAWIEDFIKFRTRIKAEQAVAYAKARVQLERASATT